MKQQIGSKSGKEYAKEFIDAFISPTLGTGDTTTKARNNLDLHRVSSVGRERNNEQITQIEVKW